MSTVLVAGATGAIGAPLVRALVSAGHQVAGLTRTPDKASFIRSLGAGPVVADALDREALIRAVAHVRPTHVIHELTALPKGGPRRAQDLGATNRLRTEGTRHLLEAAASAGVRRFLAGSFVFAAADRAGLSPGMVKIIDALQSMESQVIEASGAGLVEGVVLRYGLFYARGNAGTESMIEAAGRRLLPAVRDDRSLLPSVHVDDAVAATVMALDTAPAGSVYDIVDDRPLSLSDLSREIASAAGVAPPLTLPRWLPRLASSYLTDILALRLEVTNRKAREALGWRPRFATVRDGLAATKEQRVA